MYIPFWVVAEKEYDGYDGYIYLIERYDGVRFVGYGDFKVASYRPVYLFAFCSGTYANETPYGCVSNKSSCKYDSKNYHVIHQTRTRLR
jgi:hypothetical protein